MHTPPDTVWLDSPTRPTVLSMDGEPDPAGNPPQPDHWHYLPGLVVQKPPLFGGARVELDISPDMRPDLLWCDDGTWRVDPYGIGRNAGFDRDIEGCTYTVVAGGLVADLDPQREYLLRHATGTGDCGVQLVHRITAERRSSDDGTG